MSEITASSYPDQELALQVIRGAADSRIFCRSISALENRFMFPYVYSEFNLKDRTMFLDFRSPPKTSTLEMHISSSVVIPNTFLGENNGALEASCSTRIDASTPDVIKETSPRNEQLQKHYIARDSNAQIEIGENEVVFSDDFSSRSLQEFQPGISAQNFETRGNADTI